MKISKKLIALVVMAAFCCTLVVPVVAKAALTNCPPHHYVDKNYSTIVTKDEHKYLYVIVENEDGSVSEIWKICETTTIEEYCERECEWCRQSIPSVLVSSTTTHSSCGQ